MTCVGGGGRAAGLLLAVKDLRDPDYTLWWGIAGLLLPVAFVTLLVVSVRTITRGGRARLPVDHRGAVNIVAHLLRADTALTPDRWQAPSCHGRLVLARGQLRWHFDRRQGWTAPAGALIVRAVRPGLEGPEVASVEFEIGGTGEWAGGWRLVLGGTEPQQPARSLRLRARRRSDAALATQLASALVAQGAIDARRH
jgi:hypothetical protein